MKPLSQAAKMGQASSTWLIERAPRAMFDEYMVRPGGSKALTSNNQLSDTIAELRRVLGPVATTDPVVTALQALDGVIWDVVAEHEESAFFAAWGLALHLKGGAR